MEGGPIALVEDGDVIEIDAETRELNLLVEAEVLLVRKEKWEAGEKKMEPRVRRGTLGKYAKLVTDASRGCITDAE
jgi:dihydroxy-acid dehydratase